MADRIGQHHARAVEQAKAGAQDGDEAGLEAA